MNTAEATITPATEPSQVDPAASGDQLDAGVTEASPASGESEAPPASGEKPKSLSDVVKQAMGEEKTEAPPAEEAESAESDDEPKGKQDAPPEEKKDKIPDEALSKRAQERIRELTKERDGYKADRALVQEFKQLTGDEQGFNNLKVLLRDFSDNPARAAQMLEQLLGDAKARAGLVVKSEDIRKRVDDGLIDEPTALELEQARAERESAKKREAARQEAKAVQSQQAMVSALDVWEKSVMERSPDYESVRDVVKDTFVASITINPPGSPEEAVAAAQAAYDKVTGFLRKKVPQTASKVATSSGASTRTVQKDKSINDVVKRLLAK